MGSLTIELDDQLILRAKANAEKTGKSLPELISAFLVDLGSPQATESSQKSLFGCMRGTAEILGDIVGPLSCRR